MDDAVFDVFEGAANRARGVMKTGQQREIRIMDQAGVERYFGAGWTPSEKIDLAAFANQLDSRFPGFGFAYRLDHGVETLGRGGANRLDHIRTSTNINDSASAKPGSSLQSGFAAARNRHSAAQVSG